MLLKLTLFLAYVVLLFLLARIIETLTWIESGNLSRRLLDPMTMSVMKLKALLDQRGISYEGAIEKQELAELVESSGSVSEDTEVSAEEDMRPVSVTNFTTGSLFDEHVEDAKDSVWLVYIKPERHHVNYLADTSWELIKQKMSKFGVNTGVFDCSLDPFFCARREWYSTCLILGLPENFETKSKVTLFKYTGPFRVNNIHTWVKDSISKKVNVIENWNTYSNNWIQYKNPKDFSEVRVIMFSSYPSIPLFYSSVSVKFPGRVKFGFVQTKSSGGKDIIIKDPTVKSQTYLIITKEHVLVYGRNFGEDLTYQSMETYLKTLYPCVNDIFVLSLIVCNCLTLFELSLAHGTVVKRLMKFIWCIVKFNMCLLLLWITMLTLVQIPIMFNLTTFSLKILRFLRLSTFGIYFYKDFCFYSRHLVLTELLFSLFIIFVGYVQFIRKGADDEDQDVESDEWNFAQFRTLEHLFSPTAGLFRTGIPAIDPERMRDIPTLRQICNVPDNYISKLPKWQFKTEKQPKDIAKNHGNTKENLDNIKCDICQSEGNFDILEEAILKPICQECKQSIHNQTTSKGSKNIPSAKNLSQLNKLKQSDFVLTDQSDTDQEKEAIDEDHIHLENSQCVICLDDYTIGTWLCGLPCGHSFHQQCIHIWLNRDNHYCPVCRWSSYTPKPSTIHLHSE